jgi:hypothetical protein
MKETSSQQPTEVEWLNGPAVRACVVRGVSKTELIELAMANYTGTTRDLERRQYARRTMLDLALLVQRRAYMRNGK